MAVIAIYLIFSMLAVIWYDVSRYIIPNWLVGSLIAIYPLAVILAPAGIDWPMALLGMVIVFGVGYLLFSMRWMGGGDIKLITVCALWVGFGNLPTFIIIMSLLGGLFAVAVMILRRIAPIVLKKPSASLPRILRDKEPIPYGVAIAAGFLVMAWRGEIPVIA